MICLDLNSFTTSASRTPYLKGWKYFTNPLRFLNGENSNELEGFHLAEGTYLVSAIDDSTPEGYGPRTPGPAWSKI